VETVKCFTVVDDDMMKRIHDLKCYHQEMKRLEKIVEEGKTAFKMMLQSAGQSICVDTTGVVLFQLITKRNVPSVDMDKLKTLYPAAYEQCVVLKEPSVMFQWK